MAWFEVEHLILGANETHRPIASEDTSDEHTKLYEREEHHQERVMLLVQYNPAGIIFLNAGVYKYPHFLHIQVWERLRG